MSQNQLSLSQDFQEILNLINGVKPIEFNGLNNNLAQTESKQNLNWPAIISQIQGKCRASISHGRLCIFTASHGFANSGKESDMASYLEKSLKGETLANALCQSFNFDMRLYEMDTEDQTAIASALNDAAMTEEEFIRAMAYGMMAVEPGLECLALSAFGNGTDEAAAAITAAAKNELSTNLIAAKIQKHHGNLKGLEAVIAYGGMEIAAMCGALIAARLAKIPVVIEGHAASAALTALCHHNAEIASHVIITGSDEVNDSKAFHYAAANNQTAIKLDRLNSYGALALNTMQDLKVHCMIG